MKKVTWLAVVIAGAVSVSVSPAFAQPAASANPVSDSIRQAWADAKRDIAESATMMPDANFGYKPVDTVRTFGAILAHIAGASYEFCGAAKNVTPPHSESEFEKAGGSVADVRKVVAEAIAYCDGVYQALTDKSAAEIGNAAFGSGKAPRAAALMGNTTHFMEHYGNLVTYFRMKGLVPPSSRPRK